MPPQVGCLSPGEIAVYEDDFRKFDIDGSGMLEKDEIEKLLQLQLGRACTNEELEQYLSQVQPRRESESERVDRASQYRGLLISIRPGGSQWGPQAEPRRVHRIDSRPELEIAGAPWCCILLL